MRKSILLTAALLATVVVAPGAAWSRRRAGRMVTVKTDGSTRVRRNRAASTLSALQARDRVDVLIVTDEETTLTQALSEAADVIAAKTPPTRTQAPSY